MLAYPIASVTDREQEGFTLAGIVQAIVFVAPPISVFPLYVMIVKTTETFMPDVFWLARSNGGVNEILVLLDFVQIVPLALPQVYVIVCVKLVEYRVTVNVCAVPSVPSLAVRPEALGMVVSVTLPISQTKGVPSG